MLDLRSIIRLGSGAEGNMGLHKAWPEAERGLEVKEPFPTDRYSSYVLDCRMATTSVNKARNIYKLTATLDARDSTLWIADTWPFDISVLPIVSTAHPQTEWGWSE